MLDTDKEKTSFSLTLVLDTMVPCEAKQNVEAVQTSTRLIYFSVKTNCSVFVSGFSLGLSVGLVWYVGLGLLGLVC